MSTAAPAPSGPTGAAGTHCDLYASPTGSDASGNGSTARPFASMRHLDSALTPGQTGCLESGTYGDPSTWDLVDTNGTASGRITITAAPGASVTVKGWIDMEAAYTTVSHLNIDGSNNLLTNVRAGVPCPTPTSDGLAINGANDVLEYNNLYQSVASLRNVGIGIGWSGTPDNSIVRYNEIHDVGGCQAFDHVIYLDSGNNVQIYDNWMWNDAHGWGVQVYPHPTNARIFNNVIDHVGSGFVVGDEAGQSTNGNEIFNNVVTNSTGLPNANLTSGVAISDYWGGTPGSGNTFLNNDSFGNPGGISKVTNVTVSGTTQQDPGYVNAAAHNYTVSSSSPVAGWGLWNGTGM